MLIPPVVLIGIEQIPKVQEIKSIVECPKAIPMGIIAIEIWLMQQKLTCYLETPLSIEVLAIIFESDIDKKSTKQLFCVRNMAITV